ncbi:stellacyanin-like [Capsicum annuum]
MEFNLMAFIKRITMFLSFITIMAAFTKAAVYEVGDSKGWIVGNVDYSQWASSKNFQVIDILIFKYNKKYHNVMQVSRQEYDSCTVTDPIVTFNTGNDSITLPASGDYYYLCGIPGRCQIGQKFHVHIDAPPATSSSGSVNNPPQRSVASPISFTRFSIINMIGFCFFLAF